MSSEAPAIDPTAEELPAGEALISMDAARRHPLLCVDGRPASLNSVYRYALRGRRGIRLQSMLCGGKRCTSTQSIERWIRRLNATDAGAVLPPADAAREAHRQAERELGQAGW